MRVYAEERQERQQAAQKALEEKKERQAKCTQARKDLSDYEHAPAIYTEDKQGERVFLEDSEREKVLEDIREKITRYCR